MPRTRQSDWIAWRKSEARDIILDDLESGMLPLDDDVVSAEEAWEEMHFALPEFEHVVFPQFKARLKDHRKQVGRRQNAKNHLLAAFRHDQQLRAQGHLPGGGTHDHHGNLIFERSAAKPLLKQDVIDEKHKEMTPDELHETRDEFKEWSLPIFRRRLRQEIASQKWLHCLDCKRAAKLLKRGQKDVDPGPDSEEESDDEGHDETP